MVNFILAYMLGMIVTLNALVILEYFSDTVIFSTEELVSSAAVWPASWTAFLGGMVINVVIPAARRAYSAVYAETVGAYWTLRAKLPF